MLALWKYLLIGTAVLIIAFLLFWRLYFLRNPEKQITPGENVIVSPADGKIVKIVPFNPGLLQESGAQGSEVTVEKGLLGKVKFLTDDVAESGYFIVIRLHLYDIHYQRTPLAGTVVQQKYTRGKFLNAVVGAEKLIATLENEKNEILLEGVVKNEKVRTKIIQVAGFAARRITSFVQEGQTLEKGQSIGLINLGSQVVLVVPEIDLQIHEGQNVSGGETIIGVIA